MVNVRYCAHECHQQLIWWIAKHSACCVQGLYKQISPLSGLVLVPCLPYVMPLHHDCRSPCVLEPCRAYQDITSCSNGWLVARMGLQPGYIRKTTLISDHNKGMASCSYELIACHILWPQSTVT